MLRAAKFYRAGIRASLRWTMCLGAMAAIVMPGYADEVLKEHALTGDALTETLVVTGTRLTEAPFDQPYAFYRLSVDELDARVGRMALDRMNYGPGVFIQRTAPNQASPFVRGLTGEQTLLLFDGIRLSHAFMRPGPNQYGALVPDIGLSSVDVILGSSSTVNGSDGLTGGLDFRLALAGRDVLTGSAAWAATRLDSGNGGTAQVGADGVAGDLSWSVELGGSVFHDREGGKDAGDRLFGPHAGDSEIPNTAYDAYASGVRLAYRGFADHVLELNAGHKRQQDAPRPGGYFANSGRSDRIYRYFDPQAFTYVHLKDAWQLDNKVIDRLDTKLWWHQFDETQLRASLRNAGTASELLRHRRFDDRLDAAGIDLQATTLLGAGARHKLTWGGTYIHERTANDYREFRTPAGTTALAQLAPHNPQDWRNNTTVSDGSTYESTGLFVQDDWQIADRLNLLLGVRYSYYAWSFGDVDGHTDDFSGSIRALWRVADNQRLFAGVSRGFRAPNLTNLDGLVDRGSSGASATGNPDLYPETSVTYEAGWKWRAGRDTLQFTVFRTDIDDLMQRDFSATPAITTNVEGANLYGFETAWTYGREFANGHYAAVAGALSLLHATRDIPLAGGGTFEDYLSRANRVYGRLGLEYERGAWSGLAQVRWHDTYDDVATHPSDADADDLRLTVAGNADGSMPGYAVVDLVLGWQSTSGKRSVKFFVENVADKTYREPGSGTDGVGRNFGVTARVGF